MLSNVVRWRVASVLEVQYLFFSLKKIGFAPWPDIMLSQTLIYYWQELWRETVKPAFIPIQDGLFPGCSWMGWWKRPPSIKSVTHILQWWNLAELYLSQRRFKKYMNHVTNSLRSADISIFSPEISKFCYIKKFKYTLHFDT